GSAAGGAAERPIRAVRPPGTGKLRPAAVPAQRPGAADQRLYRLPATDTPRVRSHPMPVAMARHILVKTEDEALALKKRIAAGEAFDVPARKASACQSERLGGDLGEVRAGQMARAIDEVIFRNPLKVVHGPLETQCGLDWVQVFYRD